MLSKSRQIKLDDMEKIDDYQWELPKGAIPEAKMKVPARIFASQPILEKMLDDNTLHQTANVAWLPGIQKYSMVMPDGHWGYGFPIGGVAAVDPQDNGIVSPGGIGYDINCGVRLMSTNLEKASFFKKPKQLLNALFNAIPAGLGSKRSRGLTQLQFDNLLREGVPYLVDTLEIGRSDDIDVTEENGQMSNAKPENVSKKALSRGLKQLGTLGSGNHFLELQYVETIYDQHIAKAYGITHPDQIVVMVHTGSRGLGHQVASDSLRTMEQSLRKYQLSPPDVQLAGVPVLSDEGQSYLGAMSAAANFAWANRETITHNTRSVFEKHFKEERENIEIDLIYDVAHNIAKFETHTVEGTKKDLLIMRKGATRAFPAHHPDVPQKYKSVGQPVIVPGSMGTSSYLLAGGQSSLDLTFGSTAHGAGRVLSRTAAKKQFDKNTIEAEMREKQNIYVKATKPVILAEEHAQAYKDIDDVVSVSDRLGIGTLVAKLRPLGVIKG